MAVNKVVYGDNILIDLSSDTNSADKMLAGTTSHDKAGNPITGTIESQAAQTITPGTSDQSIAAGKYLGGVQTIKGDANLLSANIKKGVSIFGVAGSLEEGSGGTESSGALMLLDSGSFTVTSKTVLSNKAISHSAGKIPSVVVVYTSVSSSATFTTSELFNYTGIMDWGISDESWMEGRIMCAYASNGSRECTVSHFTGVEFDWTDTTFTLAVFTAKYYVPSRTYYWEVYG